MLGSISSLSLGMGSVSCSSQFDLPTYNWMWRLWAFFFNYYLLFRREHYDSSLLQLHQLLTSDKLSENCLVLLSLFFIGFFKAVSFSATCSALCNCTCSSPMKLLFLAHTMLFVWHTVLFYSHGGSLVSPNYWRSRLIFPFCCAFLQSKIYLGLHVLFNSRQVHCFQ